MQGVLGRSRNVWILMVMLAAGSARWSSAQAPGQAAEASTAAQASRVAGTIKSVQADSIVITSDAGVEMNAKLATSTRILRIALGQTDLKTATPLKPEGLQPGDRVLVRGQTSTDAHSVTALTVMVMKQVDVSAKQERDREDWQKRGVGGLVSAVDAVTGTITISSAAVGGNKSIAIRTTKTTVARRYAPDSVRFDDAEPAPLDQIKPADQLRARGTRNADGSELTAEEIVSGTFRNIAGTVTAVDPVSNSMTVQDAISKQSVVVKVSADSQVKKLPAEMAQRIAFRLKGGANGNGEQSAGHAAAAAAKSGDGSMSTAGGQFQRGPGGERANGPPDLQRFLSRLPSSKLTDLQKGEAVMIVSTQGGDSGAVTAITLLAGVEPILTASPNKKGAMLLSPWTLNSAGGESESAP